MKIYTKRGDKGQTSLFGGTRVMKDNIRVEAYGTVDELNSILGIINFYLKEKATKKTIFFIQNDLFSIGAVLADPTTQASALFEKELLGRVSYFEQTIDEITLQLPELTKFILPGGGEVGAFLQFARSVARRAERRIIQLSQKESIAPSIIIYFNRLSDLLFTLSRFINFLEKNPEQIWSNR